MPTHTVNVSTDPANSGFTPSGAEQFKDTIKDYSEILYHRAKSYAELSRINNSPIEITSENVRSAAHYIARSFGSPKKPRWLMPVQVGEYLGVAVAGVGAGHLDNPLGILAFGVGLTLAIILVVIRFSKIKEDY